MFLHQERPCSAASGVELGYLLDCREFRLARPGCEAGEPGNRFGQADDPLCVRQVLESIFTISYEDIFALGQSFKR